MVDVDLDPGVQGFQRLGTGFHLGAADIGGAKQDLALQVGKAHGIVIDQTDAADARRRQIQRHRASQPAGADHQNTGAADLCLAGAAHLAQHQMAGVTVQLFITQGHEGSLRRKLWT